MAGLWRGLQSAIQLTPRQFGHGPTFIAIEAATYSADSSCVDGADMPSWR